MRLIQHVQHDWSVRVPCLLRNNRYRGLSRPAYTILCLLYHLVKTVLFVYLFACFRVLKFFLWDIWVNSFRRDDEEFEDEVEEETEYADEETDPDSEELPFCQLFDVSDEMCLLVDHVEMCPDETAFIRVVDDEGYTPLYKRKIRRDKLDNRFIVFNGQNHYLNDKKTRPTVLSRK